MTEIHPTAIVENGAELAEDVKIGALAYIGAEVRLGPGCVVHHHGVVEGCTTLGARNEVFPFAVIGGRTQDLKYRGGRLELVTGDDCQFREYVTVHSATVEGKPTRLGNGVVILAYSHIAHDCTIGDHLVMSSQAALAGHCEVGDYVNIAWGSGVHQFVRIGSYAMLAGLSKITQDLPPFLIGEGLPASCRAINRVALRRAGYSDDDLSVAKRVYKTLYHSGLNRSQAVTALEQSADCNHPLTRLMLEFIAGSKRGLTG